MPITPLNYFTYVLIVSVYFILIENKLSQDLICKVNDIKTDEGKTQKSMELFDQNVTLR